MPKSTKWLRYSWNRYRQDKVKNLGIMKKPVLIANGTVIGCRIKGSRDPFKIGIGHDSRLTGPELKNAMIAVEAAGCESVGFWVGWLSLVVQFEEVCLWCGDHADEEPLAFYFNGIEIFSQTGGAEKNWWYRLYFDYTQVSKAADGSVKQAGCCHVTRLLI